MTNLFIIGTPIGNLGDVSKRVIASIEKCDVLFAEDTRTALAFLNSQGIKKKLESYHKDNEKTSSQKIIKELESGKTVGVMSEAGMPCISDPGAEIVKLAVNMGIKFEIIQGPTALIQGLIASGFSGGCFYFHGFLPNKTEAKKKELESLKVINAPIIFYESPHRVKDTLALMLDYFPKPISCSRELTKLHEETVFINSAEDIEKLTIKGEFVIVVNNIHEEKERGEQDYESIAKKLAAENISNQDIIKTLKVLGMKRNDAYKLVNFLK